ncbi:MAG: hypothetical protein E7481_06345 [Ruminococcaceae bacterium]|nr:hypothetical protein [Oscillospiraceae bacterium]
MKFRKIAIKVMVLTFALIVFALPTFALRITEDFKDFIAESYSLLESVTVNTVSMYDPETAETLTVNGMTLYKCKDEFQSYNKVKTNLFSHVSPRLCLEIISGGNLFNINGDLYVYPTEGEFNAILGHGSSVVEQMGYADFKMSELRDGVTEYSDYRVFFSYDRSVGFDGWLLDYIEGDIGSEIYKSWFEEKLVIAYIETALRDFIISENLNAGYEKYLLVFSENEPLKIDIADVQFNRWDDKTGEVYGYCHIDEYDADGNRLGVRKIELSILPHTESIIEVKNVDTQALLDFVCESLRFIEDISNCNGDKHNGEAPIKIGNETFYKMTGEYSDYATLKAKLHEFCMPETVIFVLMGAFGKTDDVDLSLMNVNGDVYVLDGHNRPFIDGEIDYNGLEIIVDEDDERIFRIFTVDDDGNITREDFISVEYLNGEMRLLGFVDKWQTEHGVYYPDLLHVPKIDYVHYLLRNHIVSENQKAGYEKYSMKLTDEIPYRFESVDIRGGVRGHLYSYQGNITLFAYTLLDEYDKNGNFVSHHIAELTLGEGFSEIVTDRVLSDAEYDDYITKHLIDDTEGKTSLLGEYYTGSELTYFEGSESIPSELTFGWRYVRKVHDKYGSYEDFKRSWLKQAAPVFVMDVLSEWYFNINGEFYSAMGDFGSGDGGITDKILIIQKGEDRIVYGKYSMYSDPAVDSPDYLCEIRKIDGEWFLSCHGYYGHYDGLGVSSVIHDDYKINSTFVSYVKQVICSYLISENVNCGYMKYVLPEGDYLNGTTLAEKTGVSVISFDVENCVGEAYMLVDEFDKDGSVVGSKKITVEVFPVLHELLTIEDLNTGEIVYYDPNAVEYSTEKPVFEDISSDPEPEIPEEPKNEEPVEPEAPEDTKPVEPNEPEIPNEDNANSEKIPYTITISLSTFLLYAVPIVIILIGVFVFVIIKSRPE